MTKYSKCFVFFIVVTSLSFLGFTVASVVGGRNWQDDADELTDYVFDAPTGDAVNWSVTGRRTGEQLQTSPVLPELIVAAQKDMQSEQSRELDQLDEQIAAIKPQIEESKRLIEADIKALDQRQARLAEQLEALNSRIVDVSNEAIRKSQEAYAKRSEAERRREDVFRLQNQLGVIQADHFLAVEQQKKLRDSLVRLEGAVDRLERRNRQLPKP